jgi:hypothetical protein
MTIDTSRVALALARQRLMGARLPYYLLADSAEGRKKESELTATELPPAETTNDIRHGFVYEFFEDRPLKALGGGRRRCSGCSGLTGDKGDSTAAEGAGVDRTVEPYKCPPLPLRPIHEAGGVPAA